MKTSTYPYVGYRFTSLIIAHDIWLYQCFNLSFRNVKDVLVERDITVSCEKYLAVTFNVTAGIHQIILWCR